MDSPELVPAHNFESGLGSFGTQIQRVIIIGASGRIGEALANHPERCHLEALSVFAVRPTTQTPCHSRGTGLQIGTVLAFIFGWSRTWDADRGDDCEESSTVSCSRQTDRSNRPAISGLPQGRPEGHPVWPRLRYYGACDEEIVSTRRTERWHPSALT
jgi:hypothetical protein